MPRSTALNPLICTFSLFSFSLSERYSNCKALLCRLGILLLPSLESWMNLDCHLRRFVYYSLSNADCKLQCYLFFSIFIFFFLILSLIFLFAVFSFCVYIDNWCNDWCHHKWADCRFYW